MAGALVAEESRIDVSGITTCGRPQSQVQLYRSPVESVSFWMLFMNFIQCWFFTDCLISGNPCWGAHIPGFCFPWYLDTGDLDVCHLTVNINCT